MKICSKCKAENIFEDARFCKECGTPLDLQVKPTDNQQVEDDDELEIMENSAPVPDMGKDDNQPDNSSSNSDDLDFATTPNLLDMGITDEDLINNNIPLPDGSNPKDNPEYDFSDLGNQDHMAESKIENENQSIPEKNSDQDRSKTSGSKPLDGKPKSKDKSSDINWREVIDDVDDPKGFVDKSLNGNGNPAVRPREDFDTAQQKIKSSGHKRGIAYFKSNIIQITGNAYLRQDDELSINDKLYVLKPKQLNLGSKSTMGMFAVAVVIVLAAVASFFMRMDSFGSGEIIGVILDENGSPYLETAQVKITELDEYTTTNPQGFFRFSNVPTGTYEIVYQLGEEYIGFGNATVTGDQMTLSSFSDLTTLADYTASQNDVQKVKSEPEPIASAKPVRQTEPAKQEKISKPSSKKTTKKTQRYGKLKLLANVDNARLTLEGQILGAGNNTYSKIRTGNREIVIDKKGYKPYTVKTEVSNNKTSTINANLIRDNNAQGLSADNYMSLAADSKKAGDLKQALKDYNSALNLKPSMRIAFTERAQLYLDMGENGKAAADFIRIGELQRFAGEPSEAVKSFTKALELSPENMSAHLGRAGAYQDKGNYRSAMVDFELILEQNSKDYRALMGRGVCYHKLGDHKKAEKQFTKAYKINKNDPILYQYLMMTYLARDNIKKLRRTYADYKLVASQEEFAEFKSKSRFEPVIRLIKEENR